jgi:hypothetical protein
MYKSGLRKAKFIFDFNDLDYETVFSWCQNRINFIDGSWERYWLWLRKKNQVDERLYVISEQWCYFICESDHYIDLIPIARRTIQWYLFGSLNNNDFLEFIENFLKIDGVLENNVDFNLFVDILDFGKMMKNWQFIVSICIEYFNRTVSKNEIEVDYIFKFFLMRAIEEFDVKALERRTRSQFYALKDIISFYSYIASVKATGRIYDKKISEFDR